MWKKLHFKIFQHLKMDVFVYLFVPFVLKLLHLCCCVIILL